METSKIVCVVIPVHLSNPSIKELMAFEQCVAVLPNYDIFLVAPEGLDLTSYVALHPKVKIEYVHRSWLATVKAYNKMKIDVSFYEIFSRYQYMLTFELDAYVFRDELLQWCRESYDYIGAPWFLGFDKTKRDAEIIGVGNSGFSLRNIQSCLKVLRQLDSLVRLTRTIDFVPINYTLRWLAALRKPFPLLKFVKIQTMRAFLRHEYVHEDIFWSCYIPALFKNFKVAPVSEALRFSFDASPRQCYKLNGDKLPFGCHAWAKFDSEFWSEFIDPVRA